MGMDVSALAGWGIITNFGPDDVEGWYDASKPDWMEWKQIGAYEGGHYFLGAIYEHDWRRPVTGVPLKTVFSNLSKTCKMGTDAPYTVDADLSVIAVSISYLLGKLKRDDGEPIGKLVTKETFGFHVYTQVS